MKFFQNINKPTKIIFGVGLLLILYGYFCRSAGVFFFWESLTIGWELFFISLFLLFVSRVRNKKRENKKYVWDGIAVGVLILLLVVQSILYFVVSNTDAYVAAKQYVLSSDRIRNEIGNVRGFGLIPSGSISVSSNSQGETGEAVINLLVKGDKRFKELILYLNKQADTNWEVKYIQ